MASKQKTTPVSRNGAKNGSASTHKRSFTTPGMSTADGKAVASLLQERLVSLIDLALTLKHIHWNVVGPYFIGVHQMLDPQVAGVQAMVDTTAERIATLGQSPNGLAGNLVRQRAWDDYDLGRDAVPAHLGALDVVYRGIITDHRAAIDALEDLDLVTQDMVVGQTAELEQYHWFVRAHLENADGALSTGNARSEAGAAKKANAAARRA
jgi:starvation-inducible DNA-binding protein